MCVDKYDKELKEKGVSNHAGDRNLSNKLDAAFFPGGYKNTSHVREAIHVKYHNRMGDKKAAAGNQEGAKAEYDRAKEYAANARAAREAEKSSKPKK